MIFSQKALKALNLARAEKLDSNTADYCRRRWVWPRHTEELSENWTPVYILASHSWLEHLPQGIGRLFRLMWLLATIRTSPAGHLGYWEHYEGMRCHLITRSGCFLGRLESRDHLATNQQRVRIASGACQARESIIMVITWERHEQGVASPEWLWQPFLRRHRCVSWKEVHCGADEEVVSGVISACLFHILLFLIVWSPKPGKLQIFLIAHDWLVHNRRDMLSAISARRLELVRDAIVSAHRYIHLLPAARHLWISPWVGCRYGHKPRRLGYEQPESAFCGRDDGNRPGSFWNILFFTCQSSSEFFVKFLTGFPIIMQKTLYACLCYGHVFFSLFSRFASASLPSLSNK